jgi:hypothetical protein
MLPIGECVILIKAYIHTRSVAAFGVVCNAFSEALRRVIDDWELFLCSLEHNLRQTDAPVHALWCHVQSSLPLLHFSACVCPVSCHYQLSSCHVPNLTARSQADSQPVTLQALRCPCRLNVLFL